MTLACNLVKQSCITHCFYDLGELRFIPTQPDLQIFMLHFSDVPVIEKHLNDQLSYSGIEGKNAQDYLYFFKLITLVQPKYTQ